MDNVVDSIEQFHKTNAPTLIIVNNSLTDSKLAKKNLIDQDLWIPGFTAPLFTFTAITITAQTLLKQYDLNPQSSLQARAPPALS